MKNYLAYLIIAVMFFISQKVYSQNNLQTIGEYRYAKWNGKWYTMTKDGDRGDRVDTMNVVVRLKSRGSLKEINFSKLKLPELEDVRGRFAGNFYELRIPESSDPFGVSKKLHDSGLFDVVHLNIYGRIAAVEPNDPYYTQGYHWNLNKIKMPDAWEKSKGSSSIKVAIIDVGVQHDHPDLIKNRWSGIGYDFYDMDSDPRPENIEQYKNSHGTAVTGIICANLNNALGVSGIAGGWGSQRGITFMSLRAGKYIAPNFDIMDIAAYTDAIDYAAYNGADVISCSWNTTSVVPELEMAIDAGVTSHNVVIVFSSGNYTDKVTPETKKVQFPANLYYTIAVGASTESDKRKYKNDGTDEPGWGSCYGSELDAVAPGIHISTTDYSGQYGYSTNDYYSLFNGTSSAAPHVAALSALILSINPDLYWYEVRDIIRNNADKVGGYQYTNGFNEEMGY